MIKFLLRNQQNIMDTFLGISALVIVMLLITKALPKKRGRMLLHIELSAFLLLLFNRLTYIFTGDVSTLGYVMNRLANFASFFLIPVTIMAFNFYLADLLREDAGIERRSRRLRAVFFLCVAGMAFVIIAHFTGMFYTFDEMNYYHRMPGFVFSYIIPVAALVIQLSVIFRYRRQFGKWIHLSLVLFIVIPSAAAIIQIFVYGLSLINVALVLGATLLYIFAYLTINEEIESRHKERIRDLEDEKKIIHRQFDKTVKSFVSALDGRYVHTQGHSQRVAEYSRRIAELDGKSESECEEIYYAALLHDVGRIWMPDDIVKNLGHLSDEEQEKVRQMPVIGSQILSGIDDMPNLDVGAHYHCERYDGKGYPDGLSAEKIPEAARIIAAADAYDLMASECDLTPPMPPQLIRQRFVEESGGKLDPKYAKIVLQVLDSKEMEIIDPSSFVDAVYENEFFCDSYRDHVTTGIEIREEPTRIRFRYEPAEAGEGDFSAPSLIVFDSYDGRVHDMPREIEAYRYTEFGEVWFDGHFVNTGARNMTMEYTPHDGDSDDAEGTYEIIVYRQMDHARIVVESHEATSEVIVALPDSSQNAYIGLTGEHCHVSSITIEKLDVDSPHKDIQRIADPVSYIDRLESDLPNVQINGKRTASTLGVRIKDGAKIVFHTRSLPSADLIWHCPYIVLYSSDDGNVGSEGYKEFGLVRLNGETKKSDDTAQNDIAVKKSDEFVSWDRWKERNQKGYECEVRFRKLGNKITLYTDNAGISIENTTTIFDKTRDIYAAITGDQCAITDIRVG